MNLPMAIRKVTCDNRVTDNIGKVALQRGPLMYCAEWPDNNGSTSNIIIPFSTTFTSTYKTDLLNGVMTISANTPKIIDSTITTQPFTAIPYYAWANRGKGEMKIWFPTTGK
jgi:DUF1680 family protein